MLPHTRFDRRTFLRISTTGLIGVAGGVLPALTSCDSGPTDPAGEDPTVARLRRPVDVPASSLTLAAAAGTASVGEETSHYAWLFNGSLPGPTLRARAGENARIRLLNNLPEQTIVHWHGLIVPEAADGHPRQAIVPGTTYDYEFPIVQRAGTFWYHPHAHHRTAGQIHRGLAGFFIVSDSEEDALGLPGGDREVLLMLQDRRFDVANPLSYATTSTDHLAGFLGNVAFGNGVRTPSLEVSADRYRFRILNASHARVYRLALSDGALLTVIGNDGGLLPTAATVESVFLGVGERIDLLLDFTALPVGQRVVLKSLPFSVPGTVGEPSSQGTEMNLLDIVATASRRAHDPPLPLVLSAVPALSAADAAGVRTFEFTSLNQDEPHRINDGSFDMNRVDEQIALGRIERWRFFNNSTLPHPVHLHGTHFQIFSRTGGRNGVLPYEAGWKDTVLVMPLEMVEVLVRFEWYRGLFPLHCHNLQHEDMGMMLNVEVA